jgi:hypothetical protein
MLNARIIMCALAAAGVLLIGSQVSDRQSRAAGPPGGLDVTVGNTPLPVTVTNPTVPPTTVNVGNPAALAAANAQALAPALGVGTPVAFTLSFRPQTFNTTYSVPVGQRLIMEYVSGECTASGFSVNSVLFPSADLKVTTGGIQNTHTFAMPMPLFSAPNIGNQINTEQFSHSVKIYADAGSNVTFATPNFCNLTVSGQLVTP